MFNQRTQDLFEQTMESSDAPTRELTLEEAVSIAIQSAEERAVRRGGRSSIERILEAAPDHHDALHYAGVLAHQLGRGDEAVALIEKSLALAPGRADCHSNLGIVLQAQGRLDEAIDGLPARDRDRSESRQCVQQSRRPVAGDGQAGRSRGRLSHGHSPESRSHRCLHQPRHPPERVEAAGGGGRVLLQSDPAQAEAPGGPKASGAGALHAGRGRRGGEDLRGMARGGAGRPDCAAHAGGLHRSRHSRRARRTGSSKGHSTASPPASSRSWRSCRTARRRWSRRCWRIQGSSRRRASTCSMPAAEQGCAVRSSPRTRDV